MANLDTRRSYPPLQVLAIVAGSGENSDSLLAQLRMIAEKLRSELKAYLAEFTLGSDEGRFVSERVTRPKLID
jgi:hypothetical protein